MLAYRKLEPAPGLTLKEAEEPIAPGPDEVIVSVQAVGICGSDLHVAQWSDGYDFMRKHLPVTLGHEFAGVIETVGDNITRVKPGDRVTIWPSCPCGECVNCNAGEPRNCVNKATLGLYRDGAFAPRVRVRGESAFVIPDHLPFRIAALTEPLCVGHQAVQVGAVTKGDHVIVLGPGTIGQAIAIFARKAGAAEIAIAGMDDPVRLEVCRELGFDKTYDLAQPGERARMESEFSNADKVFEATGHAESIRDGLAFLRTEGILTMTGIHPTSVSFDATPFVRSRQQIRGSHGSAREDWLAVIQTLSDPATDVSPMITHELPLSRVAEGFELAASRTAAKVLIYPQINGEEQ